MDMGESGPRRVMCPYTLLLVSYDSYIWTGIRTLDDGRMQFVEYDNEDVERWYWTKLLPELKRII